jgi:hypothetical protein
VVRFEECPPRLQREITERGLVIHDRAKAH